MCFSAFLLFYLALTCCSHAQGTLYYTRFQDLVRPAELRRVRPDGSGDQLVPVNLPSPIYPTASRDGRLLLLTSPDPGRPFKLSNNVFIQDLVSGRLVKATSFEDTVQINNTVILTNDLGKPVGNRDASGYTIHSPYHKALSPDGTALVVLDLRKTGSVTRDTAVTVGTGEIYAGSTRIPVVDVYRIADASPVGSYVFLGVERTGYNQGGDGVDWHPFRNEVVATVSSDIPATGTAGIASMEGTVLAVFTAPGPSQFLRRLGNATGQWDIFSDGFSTISASASQHDYAPAISPNGERVAYLRHVLRLDSRTGLAPMPAQCSIRIINYDGSGDREVLRFTDGLWVTRVAWSPNGTQLAFDLAPQMVLNGLNSLLGDATRSEVYVVNTDGSNPHRVLAAPAAFPTWAPDLAPVNVTAPTLQVRRDGQRLLIDIDPVQPGREIRVEGTVDWRNWENLFTFNATQTRETVFIEPGASATAYYRIRVF